MTATAKAQKSADIAKADDNTGLLKVPTDK